MMMNRPQVMRRIVRRLNEHAKYPKTFSPIRLPQSGLVLENRVLMGSMHTGLEEKHGKNGLDEMATFYAERARGGAGIIVTGGVAPNRAGWVLPMAGKLNKKSEAKDHLVVTKAVHDEGGKIVMQILHAGRYAYHPWAVGPSTKKAPINYFKPHALTSSEIEATIADFGRCAELAREAGYDGVEIMGSEGYLINQFLAPRTNSDRTDEWGGEHFENRSRLAVRIARQVRHAAGMKDFAVIFRVSLLELVENGMSFDESLELSKLLEAEGVDIINSGVGWHEARIPTIATCVPRAAFSFTTAKLRKAMQNDSKLLFCATNRVNSIQVLEDLLQNNTADLVSMARPFLADPDIVNKAKYGKEDDINTCIACNQACLDHTFKLLPISCLVNPRAGHEQTLHLTPTSSKLQVAVLGGGVAGLSCAAALAERGHSVTLFEASDRLGGQFVLAANVPGKEEFAETLRYFKHRLNTLKVNIKLSTPITSATDLTSFDKLILATGVTPRQIELPILTNFDQENTTQHKLPRVRSYAQVLEPGAEPCGPCVAVIGAGGIGFDVSEFLISTHDGTNLEHFFQDWGVDPLISQRGGLLPNHTIPPPKRQVYLLQRKAGSFGATLGKTTGWIRRATLKNKKVTMLDSCTYTGIEPGALIIDRPDGTTRLPVTDIVLCAGQLTNDTLLQTLKDSGVDTFVIGGALEAKELDAKRAIDQGYRLAANIEHAKPGDVFNMPTGWKAKALDFLATTLLLLKVIKIYFE